MCDYWKNNQDMPLTAPYELSSTAQAKRCSDETMKTFNHQEVTARQGGRGRAATVTETEIRQLWHFILYQSFSNGYRTITLKTKQRWLKDMSH